MYNGLFLYRIRCTGSNLPLLISRMISKDIKLHNVIRNEGNIEFSLSNKGYNLLKDMETGGYNIEVVKVGGVKSFNKLILSKLGLIIGLITSIVCYIFLSNRVFYINISGLNDVKREDVLEELNSIGIDRMSIIPSDLKVVEDHLLQKFDFSLVSVVHRGNAIIINVKEEIAKLEEEPIGIVAEYDMVIKSIDVFSGTSNAKSGDIVRAGQTIVYPYIVKGDKQVMVEPKAKIVASRYISKSYTFYNEEEIEYRSGKSETIQSYYSLGKLKFFKGSKDIIYQNYELEESDEVISHYFLPLRISKVKCFELIKKTINRDFSEEKDKIIEDLKEGCYGERGDNKIINEGSNIIEMSFGYIVNYHIEIEEYLEY